MRAKKEIYARFGVQLRNNRRCFRAEKLCPGSMGLYLFMVLDARGEMPEVDGFVSEEVTLSAWGLVTDYRSEQLEALCSVDLIERVSGGFRIVKYEEHNDTRKVIAENRKVANERMKRHRARASSPSSSVTDNIDRTNAFVPISISNSISDLSEGESEREAEEVTSIRPSTAKYRVAYAEGIERVKGSPYAWPTAPQDKYADQALGQAILTFAKSRSTGEALRSEKLLEWIAAAASDFAQHVITAKDDPKYWSHFSPKGLVRFLSAEVRAEEARHVG